MITKQMVKSINEIINQHESVLCLKFDYVDRVLYVDIRNNKFIKSKIINVTDEFMDLVTNYFKNEYNINLSHDYNGHMFYET